MLKRIRDWLAKLLTESVTAALTQLLSVSLLSIFIAFSGVTLTVLAHSLSSTIAVPSSLFAILVMFALVGVLIPTSRIVAILNEHRLQTHLKGPAQTSAVKIKFEDLPREWRARIRKSPEGWQVDSIEVYCTRHNLRLQPEATPNDPRNRRAGTRITSICRDCQKERIAYKEGSSWGFAIHADRSWTSFEEELKSRFVREAEK